jgi:glycosyltransferase involved in cell wall biosynthesis
MKTLSVCIPTYEMRGLGHVFLKESFDVLHNQTYKDFDVVICDNSKQENREIQKLCEEYSDKLEIHYFTNPKGTGLASNLNYVIENKCATGKFIKILGQDDYLYNEKSLEILMKNIDQDKDYWIATACIHTRDNKTFIKPHYPRYNNMIHLGYNTIGGLSIMTFRNENLPLYDASLIWLPDCEYYKKCYNEHGLPKIIDEIITIVRLGEHNITNIEATMQVRRKDFDLILARYEKGFKYWLYKIINRIESPLRRLKMNINNLWQKY